MPSPRQCTRLSSPVVFGVAVDVRDTEITGVISVTTEAFMQVGFEASEGSSRLSFTLAPPKFDETASIIFSVSA
jgi:hypothetical protein